jgi:hypothetical protein
MFTYFNKASTSILVYILLSSTPYTPLDKKIVDTTDDETLTEEWTLDQPVAQTKTTAIVEVKGTVDVVLTPLVAEALDRYYLCLKIRLLLYTVMHLHDISKWNTEFIN